MNRERWQQVQALFHAALERPEQERDGFLRESCAGDVALMTEVRELLSADAYSGTLLSAGADSLLAELARDVVQPALEGRRVGPYVLRELLGSGGMGAVYRADREDVQLTCALKLVRGGLAAPERIERFLLERRVLARLQHPNIARILDAGVTDDGTPWYALELVEGKPIDEYCATHAPGVAERLRLFEKVCDAVAYAHRNLIVHRDIKPGNILVTAHGEPKLLDFGIAKLVQNDDEALTRAGAQVLTPAYAAPEQLGGGAITTATDVYALGLVLKQLLAGLKIGKDVEAIVGHATAAEPERRYGSAAELLDDLVRQRMSLPVVARPDTWTYRTRRFVRRNRAGVGAAALLVILLATFAGTMTVQQAATARERDRARTEAAKSKHVSDFLVQLFDVTDPFSTSAVRADSLSMRDFIVARGEKVLELDDQPEVQLQALNVVGHMYFSLGLYDQAARMYERARGLGRQLHPAGSTETVTTLIYIGDLQRIRNEFAASVQTLRAAVVQARSIQPGMHETLATALHALGDALRQAGQLSEAEAVLRESLATRRAVYGLESREAADALNNLGLMLHTRGDYAQARPLLEEAIRINRRALPPTHPQTSASLNNLGLVLKAQGDLAGAAAALGDALEIKRALWGRRHWRVANGVINLAGVLILENELAEAEPLVREGLDIVRAQFGEKHELIGVGLGMLGTIYEKRGDRANAERYLRASVASLRAVMPAGHARIQKAESDLAQFYARSR